MKLSSKYILILIIVLAALLRLYKLTDIPLYGDELTMVYDAYSISKTGTDQTGQYLPLTFRMGAGRPAGYVYASIPFVYLFGPNALGVRLLSVFSGLGIILLVYLMGKRLFNEKLGLISAFFVAISPWSLSLSRGGFEAHFALFLSLLGTYLFILAEKRTYFYILSALVFGLIIHTYPTYKLTLPIFLILLCWFRGFKYFITKVAILPICISILILFLAAGLAIQQSFTAGAETRFWNINIFSRESLREGIIQKVNLERSINELKYPVPIIFHNRLVEYSLEFFESYIRNFSPEFLFLHGDSNPRHNMTQSGVFYLVDVIFILFGFIYLITKKHKKLTIFFISWILIVPLATAFLLDPHALRNGFMLPPLIVISALGVLYLTEKNFLVLKISLVVLLILQGTFIAERIFFLSAKEYGQFWADSAKLITDIAHKEEKKYDYIIISDRIDNVEYAYQVYSKIDTNLVIAKNKKRITLDKYEFKKFGNVYIGAVPVTDALGFMNRLPGSVMFIANAEDRKVMGLADIYYENDRSPAFMIKRKVGLDPI